MTERLFLPEKPTGNTPQAADALAMLHRVRNEHGSYDQLDRNANKAKHGLLATIFEESLRYEGDPDAKAALVAEVNRLAEVQAHKRWEATLELDSADIILVTILGIGSTKSTKSQWLKAIIKGRTSTSDRKEFFELLEKKGIVEVGKDDPNDDQPSGDGSDGPTPLTEPSAVDRLLNELATVSKGAPTIALEVEPDEEVPNRLLAALLVPQTDEAGAPTGNLLVLKKSHDEKLIEHFAKLTLPKRRERTAKELRRIANRLITRLNRFAIDTATHPEGRMKGSACISFIKAARLLGKLDGGDAYFTGSPHFPLTEIEGGREDRGKLTIVNPDFHLLDPGRYIGNAKQGALLPYEVKGPAVRECQAEFGEWVHSIRKPPKSAPTLDDDAYVTLDEILAESDTEAVSDEPVAEETAG